MKKLFKPQFLTALVVAFTLFLASCSGDDVNSGITPDDPTPTAKEIIVTPTNGNTDERGIELTEPANTTVKVNVSFLKSENDMSRLYITKNEYGTGIESVAYEIAGTKTKGDGSIDVSSSTDRKNIVFSIPFETPTTTDGTVVYTLWMTRTKGLSSRGDFRDPSKRNAISEEPVAVGVVVINAGSGSSLSGNNYNQFSAIMLAAPLADGSSESFISIFDGEKYTIKQGEEFASFWDFGYYWLVTSTVKATFSSAYEYRSDIVDITKLTGVEKDQLNHCYFAHSTFTTESFDAVDSFDDLESIIKPTTEKVHNLEVNSIIEFVDEFGNKGLIKITALEPGFGSGDYIKFDVKVQARKTNTFLP